MPKIKKYELTKTRRMDEIRFDRVKQNGSLNNALQNIIIGYGYTLILKQAVAIKYTTFMITPRKVFQTGPSQRTKYSRKSHS